MQNKLHAEHNIRAPCTTRLKKMEAGTGLTRTTLLLGEGGGEGWVDEDKAAAPWARTETTRIRSQRKRFF